MRNMSRQGGSVKVFIVVGTILVLIALGVLYGAKHFVAGDKAGGDLAINQPDQSEVEDSNRPSNEVVNEDRQDETPSQEPSVDTPPASSGDDSVTGQDAEESEGVSTPSPSTDRDEGPVVEGSLPQTGPAENINSLVVALITVSLVAYVRSLRHL